MTVFNKENKGYLEKKYPLFFGDDLGIFDTINVQYPEIEELYQLQMSQIWNENEVDLTQDRMDMLGLPTEVVDLMVKTIGWQTVADSVASRSIAELLLPYCSNDTLQGMLTAQSLFEVIHSRTYSHIIKQTFVDPNQMLEDIYNNTQTLVRSEVIVKAFDSLQALPKDASLEDKRKALILAFTALFALEAIAFMASFAVTFAIVETDVFQGIGALVALICRDEVLHTRMDYTVLDILLRDKEWVETIGEAKGDIKAILNSVVSQELNWSDYLFSEGRQVIGLSSELLREYVLHMAKPVYDAMGVSFDFESVDENPLPYMVKYIDPSKMQSAAQEINITSYNVGVINNDTSGLDLDFDF
jgi:ribonucleoside-diphosphate reductase beta chain